MNLEDTSWKYLSFVCVISVLHTKVYVFSDSVLRFGKMNENPQSNYTWEDRLTWFKSSEYKALETIHGGLLEFEWGLSSHDSPHCSFVTNPRVTVKIDRNTRKIHWTDCLHVDVQRHLMGI